VFLESVEPKNNCTLNHLEEASYMVHSPLGNVIHEPEMVFIVPMDYEYWEAHLVVVVASEKPIYQCIGHGLSE
jgi:hypothetical protein